MFIPLMPEFIEAVQEKEGIKENAELNDKASGMFNMSYGIGCLVGPILGGFFNDMWGFRSTCDIMAGSAFVMSIVYFWVNVWPYAR